MRLETSLILLSTCMFVLSMGEKTQRQEVERKPSGFSKRSSVQYDDDDNDSEDYDAQAQTPVGYRSRLYDYQEEEQPQQQQQQEPQQRQSYVQQGRKQQQAYSKKDSNNKSLKQIEEELEEEEPDRLAILLEKSQFSCGGKTTGYYADDSINCEVFHYCQENQKHSWVCPEGFTFHQVHLICMPPSGENICEQSAKYHVVNEYLYKPLNLQEHQTKPNVTLRYSERYYPENFYEDERYDADDRISHVRQPVQVGFNAPQQRKAPTSTPSPSPLPYRFASQQQQQQQHVYRSPEEINISLQQRRPQYFLGSSTTPRYNVDEDYGYEK